MSSRTTGRCIIYSQGKIRVKTHQVRKMYRDKSTSIHPFLHVKLLKEIYIDAIIMSGYQLPCSVFPSSCLTRFPIQFHELTLDFKQHYTLRRNMRRPASNYLVVIIAINKKRGKIISIKYMRGQLAQKLYIGVLNANAIFFM